MSEVSCGHMIQKFDLLDTDHFSGSGKAVDQMCVCVCW